jgi:hypothetical protein
MLSLIYKWIILYFISLDFINLNFICLKKINLKSFVGFENKVKTKIGYNFLPGLDNSNLNADLN